MWIKDAPSIGGLEMREVTDGSLVVTDAFFSGTVLVSKSNNAKIALMNACSTQPGAMDILLEEIDGMNKNIIVFSTPTLTTGTCVPQLCGIGDLLITRTNVRNVRVGGKEGCKLAIDSDTTITENTNTSVLLSAVDSAGDVMIRGNDDITIRGTFGYEDITISSNKDVFANLRNAGSLKFEENDSVELVCSQPSQLIK